MDALKLVENSLVETVYRNLYYGHQIQKDLAVLQDVIDPTNQAALDFVKAWMLTLDSNETYRKSVVQNNLLDLHDLLVSIESLESLIDSGEVISA